jgi:PAS domain S-box-containing protein
VTGEITDVNPFLIQLLGYSRDEFLGKKLWEVGAFKNTKASKDTFKLLQEDGYVRYEDLPLETKDGRLIAVEFVSNAYLAGEVRVMQCNIRDISDRKRAETADRVLTVLNQEKLKTSFIADVTHELRTPLAIIKGNIELAMRDKSIKHGFNDTFLKINLEINHLSEILSDLAILTSENSDFHIKIATSKINLNDVLHHVVNRLSVIAQKKSISIDLQTIPSGVILGDMEYLKKLFSNIISNAIYYGKEKGSITISGALADNMIIIAVSDDGIGIAKEDLANIFERFYRTDKAREANSEGTGLGLAICKWITEAHHGQISATSAQNKGTTFTIALPLAHS